MAKISIIIPCYNAQKTIDSCFRSLENQTIGMHNLEVIFVNDASTDGTLGCLLDFEKKYPENVLVVNCEKNGRQGKARNIGLSYATSEYVGFADDDDTFEPEMFQSLYQKARDYRCDVVMCKYDTWEMNGRKSADGFCDSISEKSDVFYEITNTEERLAFITMSLPWVIWIKIYRKDLIMENQIRFPEGYIYDDICFTELIYQYVQRIYMIDEIFYHHMLQEKSASIDPDRIDDMMGFLDVHLIMLQELKDRNKYEPYKNTYNEILMRNTIGLVETYLRRYGKIKDDVFLEIKRKIFPYRQEFINNPLLEKIWNADDRDLHKKIAYLLTDQQINI